MATKTYGTTAIPSDVVTVLSGSTVDISIGFNAVVGLVGGMDTSTGTASAGTVKEVKSASEAQDYFGDESELHRAVRLAYANGVKNIFAVGVTETSVTNESASQSGSTANAPIFNPDLQPEHSITFTDTTDGDLTVNIVYDDTVSTPTDADTVNINPITGDYEADAAATGSYEIDYDYGDYTTAMDSIVQEDVRFVAVGCEEGSGFISPLATDLDNEDDDFNFMRGVVGGVPGQTEANYSDTIDDQRICIVQPPLGDNADDNLVRNCFAVAGLLASAPLGESRTGTNHGKLDGLNALNTDYSTSDLKKFANDHQLLPLKHGANIYVVKDMTTSTDAKFERVYATEIVDEAVEVSHQINEAFIGDLNTEENRAAIRDLHRGAYAEMRDDRPPLLDEYSVTVSKDSTNDDEVDVEIGLDVVDVMDTIDVTMTVGDVTQSTVA